MEQAVLSAATEENSAHPFNGDTCPGYAGVRGPSWVEVADKKRAKKFV